MAGAVRVGQAAGADDVPAAERAGWASIALGAASMSASALAFWLVPGAIVWVYAGSGADPELARRAVALLGIAAVFQLVDGTQAAAAGALRGLKDTRFPMLIGAVSYWGLGLGLGAYPAVRRWNGRSRHVVGPDAGARRSGADAAGPVRAADAAHRGAPGERS